MCCESTTEKSPVRFQNVQIGVTEPSKESCRSFDVGHHECDQPSGQGPSGGILPVGLIPVRLAAGATGGSAKGCALPLIYGEDASHRHLLDAVSQRS